jgi:hypothetical protein
MTAATVEMIAATIAAIAAIHAALFALLAIRRFGRLEAAARASSKD